MKALLIADESTAIENISQVLETAGYDVIVYKWLIKALDNIEEIAPHLIVVSTKDYPRHWKTLAQFSTTAFSAYKPAIVLYAEGGLDEEETKKAKALNVRGIFDTVDVDGLEALREILVKEIDIYSGKLIDEDGNEVKVEVKPAEVSEVHSSEEIPAASDDVPDAQFGCNVEPEEVSAEVPLTEEEDTAPAENNSVQYISYVFTNPVSGALVTGYASNFDGKSFCFKADIDDFTKNLHTGVQIPCGTMKIDSDYSSVSATVKSNAETLVLEIA